MTLLATQDVDGNPLATIDGSTWDPWAERLLFTTENQNAGTYAATPGTRSTVEDVSGALGRGGYEGIQDDSDGNIWIVEDIGAPNKPGTTAKHRTASSTATCPAPGRPAQRQARGAAGAARRRAPITQATQTPLPSDDQKALHTYGKTFDTRWATIHDTAVDGHQPFNANPRRRRTTGRRSSGRRTGSSARLALQLLLDDQAGRGEKLAVNTALFEIILRGRYGNIRHFIAGLTELEEFVTVERFSLERGGEGVRAYLVMKRRHKAE